MIYVGIDPGLHGAVALILSGGSVIIKDTPTMVVEGDKKRTKYDTVGMAAILKEFQGTHFAKGPEMLVVLESVHSMPKQGVASSFTFGEGLGMWKGIIAAYGLPLELVSPQRWKKHMMADQGKDKSASRYKAINLFPQVASQLSRVKDDGRAEALLMAEYGRQTR